MAECGFHKNMTLRRKPLQDGGQPKDRLLNVVGIVSKEHFQVAVDELGTVGSCVAAADPTQQNNSN